MCLCSAHWCLLPQLGGDFLEIIYTYIKNIGCFAVFSAIVRMISPEGSFKSYINMFLGLVFIVVMLNPLSVILKTAMPELKDYVMREGAGLGAELFREDDENRDIVVSQYRTLAEERISGLCEGYVEGASVRAEIEDDFSLRAVYIEGTLIGDGEKLISVIDRVFGCGEENIFLSAKEE